MITLLVALVFMMGLGAKLSIPITLLIPLLTLVTFAHLALGLNVLPVLAFVFVAAPVLIRLKRSSHLHAYFAASVVLPTLIGLIYI
ncbi:hypothetical protein [Vibrio paucivorans]|uniref:Uncharacterized protein n=1 Tax=Vibrio paucivorans TaxID=2829489 RepID=A0A9X3HSF6_9VIBR|nr:hypothetical protein [Vibrio paucivorans]MCW8334779.1 hypothetical protein [Vibrio paucivorans]